jgi:cell cycle arrest protein BUB3
MAPGMKSLRNARSAIHRLTHHLSAPQFEVAQPPDDAVSRVVFAPESSTRLLVSSWDKNVYLYEVDDGDVPSAKLVRQFEHRAPVMDVCFGTSDNEAFTAGVDHRVTR